MSFQPDSCSLGALLRARREALHLTQETVAERVGVSQGAVAYWEGDKVRPSLDNLKALAKVLRVAPAKLLAAVA